MTKQCINSVLLLNVNRRDCPTPTIHTHRLYLARMIDPRKQRRKFPWSYDHVVH